MFVGTKIHTGGGGVLIQLARWTLPRVLTFVNAPFCRFQMNSIDWNQFHTPQEAIEYCEGAIGQDPPKWAEGYQAINCFRRRLSSLTQPLGAGLMTPYHLELIRQTFDGLFRPSSPDSAGKDLLLDIGGEEDEPEREEPSSPAPAATHTAPGAPPAPTPTAPKAPTALTARPTTPASGAVEHKDKGTGAARPILDDDDVPSPPKPKKAAPAAAKPKKDREAPEEARRRPRWPPMEISSSSSDEGGRAPEPKAKAERKRARPTDPDDFSPEAARQVLQAHVLLSSIDPCPSLARPLAYERLGAIVEWFEKLGAAVLFSIIVQTSALDEARYQVVDGSHRFQVARIIVDPRRVSELPPEITAEQRTELRQRVEKLNKLHPRSGRSLARCLRPHNNAPLPPAQHLKEDYIDVAVYNTLDPEAMLELQHRVNLLTHDARFGSSTFDVLLNLKRASLQAPKRYIREDPDFATHLEPALKELHFPKGEDAPAKLVKILECFSLEMLCALSQLPVERQPSATNLWRIFEARDAEMNRWLARAMLEGSFSGSEATSTAAADLKKPIRQAEQTFMLLEAHDAAEVAAGDHPPVLYLPPDEAAREILRCHLVRTETFAFMNCLNVRPFPFRKGKVRLPAFSEELGCPFERLNETDVGNMPQEITFMDGRRLSEFELVLGYWLGWCAAQLPPAMQDYLMPEHCPYARLWEEMGHHDIPRASKRMLKTVDRELREERRALREEAASEHPEPPKSEPAKRATLKALLSQAEPTSEAEAKAAEADDEYEVKACALPPESATEEAQPSPNPAITTLAHRAIHWLIHLHSAFSGSLLRLKLSPRPILLQFAGQFFPHHPSFPQVPELSSHIHSSHSANILFVPAISSQTLDSIDSRVNSYPFLPYFIHQRFSPNQLHHLIPYPAHLH
ncbi:hypothetical protein PAPYR_9832 [Paratrimastix pyriformis]|uniref:ParB/Sulfiredoxin domain-containing protein n=1 Tax=Paratrimastix pyriformis TaxID=342808 RepID=A0ABQ8U7C9_9EUKA|nr:hypothetical protein PAPYR_9832 [Paratrimastix pyriformis]